MQPAIFLDRDGVIIENRANYVRSWADVEIFPQALEALAKVVNWPGKIVMVTNQSAVGRGLMGLADAEEINRRLLARIAHAGGRVDGVFLCPHAPAAGCDCRKPQPGLFFQAARVLDIDIGQSAMVGDAWSDMQAGQAAGVRWNLLVRTGRGAAQLAQPKPAGLGEVLVFDDLSQVIAWRLAVETDLKK